MNVKKIPIENVAKEFHIIELQNSKQAILKDVIRTKVPEINNKEEINVFIYNVPCPLCDSHNRGYSYNGKYFNDIQLSCKNCGIYFRPIVKRKGE